MQLVKDGKTKKVQMLITTSPVNYQDETSVLVILEDVTELEALRSILPICVNCKKIRDDKNYWEKVESCLSKYLLALNAVISVFKQFNIKQNHLLTVKKPVVHPVRQRVFVEKLFQQKALNQDCRFL